MTGLKYKAALWLFLPALALVIALTSAFQNPGRFSGAVGRREFLDSLLRQMDSLRSAFIIATDSLSAKQARLDTILSRNGLVVVNDSLRVVGEVRVVMPANIDYGGLKVLSNDGTDTTIISTKNDGVSNRTAITDIIDNVDKRVGVTTAGYYLKANNGGNTLWQVVETNLGNGTLGGNLTVTDTNFVGSQRIGATGTVLKGVQIATAVNNVLMIIIDNGADTLFYGPPDSTKVH